jgi:hypothetical protein
MHNKAKIVSFSLEAAYCPPVHVAEDGKCQKPDR